MDSSAQKSLEYLNQMVQQRRKTELLKTNFMSRHIKSTSTDRIVEEKVFPTRTQSSMNFRERKKSVRFNEEDPHPEHHKEEEKKMITSS